MLLAVEVVMEAQALAQRLGIMEDSCKLPGIEVGEGCGLEMTTSNFRPSATSSELCAFR